MERLLLFCGVWIIIMPILFQNSYFEEHKKYTLSTQIIGFFAFLMGILHFFNIVKMGHYLDVVLFCVLFVQVGKLSYDKIKNENAKIIRTACCISITLEILSLVIVVQDIREVASAIVILTCSLIALSVFQKRNIAE